MNDYDNIPKKSTFYAPWVGTQQGTPKIIALQLNKVPFDLKVIGMCTSVYTAMKQTEIRGV